MNNMKISNTLYCMCIPYGNLRDPHKEVKYSERMELEYFSRWKQKLNTFTDSNWIEILMPVVSLATMLSFFFFVYSFYPLP